MDARASNRQFLNPPSGALLTREGLCHVEFQGAPEDALNWLVGSADRKNAFHQMLIPGWLQAFFALPAVLASEVGYTGKTIAQNRLAPDSLIYLVPATFPIGFLGRCSFGKMSRTNIRSRELLILLFCRDHSTPPLLGSKHGMRSLGFRWSYADIGGVSGSRSILHQRSFRTSHRRCQESWCRCSRHIVCQRQCRCSRSWSVTSQLVLQWNVQTDSTNSISRADGLFAPSHQRTGDGARPWSRVFIGAQQSWCSPNP